MQSLAGRLPAPDWVRIPKEPGFFPDGEGHSVVHLPFVARSSLPLTWLILVGAVIVLCFFTAAFVFAPIASDGLVGDIARWTLVLVSVVQSIWLIDRIFRKPALTLATEGFSEERGPRIIACWDDVAFAYYVRLKYFNGVALVFREPVEARFSFGVGAFGVSWKTRLKKVPLWSSGLDRSGFEVEETIRSLLARRSIEITGPYWFWTPSMKSKSKATRNKR